jgi:predicted metal-binding protein
MQISQLLRECVERFNQAADVVCFEYAIAIRSSGICSPCDRIEFEKLVKIKMVAIDSESMATLHTITGDNHVLTKLTA